MNVFISVVEAGSLYQKGNLCVLDCRGDLNDHELGHRQYGESHLPTAQFVDGERDLTGALAEHGGRHPLPDLEIFAKKMELAGLSDNSIVLAYGLYAPRLIFLLNLIGINDCFVLDGGFLAWQQAGMSIEKAAIQPVAGKIETKINNQILVTMSEVKTKLYNPQTRLIDSRAPERYRGEVEPLDKIAGHIPGADNYFWQSNFDSNGFLKSEEELKAQLQPLNLQTEQEKILYCGSGITAAYNYLVFKKLGITSRVYAGSYSDWLSYPDNRVETLKK